MGVRAAIAAAIVALSVSAASAFQSDGGPFRVNTYTTGNQINPAIGALDDGGFVIVWESDQDDDGLGIYGQTYDEEGVPANEDAEEFPITDYTTGDQRNVSVAGLDDGNFVVTWSSDDRDESGFGVFAQILDIEGDPALGDFQVNTYTSNDQNYARVARLPDAFVVVWTSENQDGNGEGIFGRRFDVDGAALGGEFQVNTYITGDQRTSSVHGIDGGFVVVWTSEPRSGTGQDGSRAGVFAQRFNLNGTRAGTEFQLNTITTNDQVRPVVTAAPGAGFLVTWEGRSLEVNATSTDGVAAQLRDANGVAAAAEFLVNTYTSGNQEDTSVSAQPGREALVVWESRGGSVTGSTADTSGKGIFGRVLNRSGALTGTEFQVNTYTTEEQDDPVVTATINGRYIVAWESTDQDGSNAGIYAQRFTSDLCGDANGDNNLNIRDALRILKAATSGGQCTVCLCDADGNGTIAVADALNVLKAALGDFSGLACAAC